MLDIHVPMFDLQLRSARAFASVLAAALLGILAAGAIAAAPASATIYPCFTQLPGRAGIPPWGFHTSAPLAGTSGWYSRAYGNIDLAAHRISGKLCQAHFVRHHEGLIVMRALSPIISHSHVAVMWGYPGNEITTRVRVVASSDRSCRVNSVGIITMFASYNGVRSDSVSYRFGRDCAHEDHLYHGPQVNAQVPPL